MKNRCETYKNVGHVLVKHLSGTFSVGLLVEI